jgi:ABC-type dipeptide/oligopeptide/nickel transport system permease subunit
MLAAGVPYLTQAWWVTAVPGLAVFLTVAAVNLLGSSGTRATSVSGP